MSEATEGLSIFISYSHKDESYKESLEEHLEVLRRQGKISSWSDRRIMPGSNWKAEIDKNIESADIILLLLSSSFIASGYCYEKELAIALKRHEEEKAVVVPIFIRPTDLADELLMGIQGLPKDAASVSEWGNQDLAWRQIATSIRGLVNDLQSRKTRKDDTQGFSSLQDTLRDMADHLDQLCNSDELVGGLHTGLIDLDKVIDGLHPGQLMTVASRPGMGKTNLSLRIAGHVGITEGLPVLIFSTKTSKQEVTNRILTGTGLIPYSGLLSGQLNKDDWKRLAHTVQKMMDSTILIDDSTGLGLNDFRDRCLSMKRECGALGLVILDSITYLQEFQDSLDNEGKMARFLKALARELGTSIIVTAPVTRLVELRPNKRPVLSDLGNWHELGNESDVVLFIYRGEYYGNLEEAHLAELIIARNQYGPQGTVRLVYENKCGGFLNMMGVGEG